MGSCQAIVRGHGKVKDYSAGARSGPRRRRTLAHVATVLRAEKCLRAGDFFGELALLKNAARAASILAVRALPCPPPTPGRLAGRLAGALRCRCRGLLRLAPRLS
jgi:hypothetical protein